MSRFGSKLRRQRPTPYTGPMQIPPFVQTNSRSMILPLVLVLLMLPACSDGVQWSSRERQNAVHLLASLQLTSEAAGIANSIESDADYTRQRGELQRALRAAHWNAVQVEDTVLDKLHPQLYSRFRLGYQRALAAMVRAYQQNDPDAAQEAAGRVRTFMEWYRQENHRFRWWDEAMPR